MTYWNGMFSIEDVTQNTTPLWTAALHGHVEEVKQLILANADYKAKCSEHESTPLHIAALMGHTDIVMLLIEKIKKDDPDSHFWADKDRHGNRPLSYACAGINAETVETLIKHIPIRINTNYDCTIDDNHKDLKLAATGCSYSVYTNNILSCFEQKNIPIRNDHQVQTMRILLLHGYLPDFTKIWDIAISNPNTKLLKLLMTEGKGRRGLHIAYDEAYYQDGNIMHIIVRRSKKNDDQSGVDVQRLEICTAARVVENKLDRDGDTPLDHAISMGRADIVKYLIHFLFKRSFSSRVDQQNDKTIHALKQEAHTEAMRDVIDEEYRKYKANTTEMRQVAVMMGLHERLGLQSFISKLEKEVCRIILDMEKIDKSNENL
jgi:ankyrin repeat protein